MALGHDRTTAEGEESIEARIERLGRQRPDKFTTLWTEVGFCSSLLASMLMAVSSTPRHIHTHHSSLHQEYFISGFNVILPTLASALDIPAQSQTWPANVFSLTLGAFLLPFGRLADIYGGRVVFTLGVIWFFLWSLIGGFSRNYVMLNFCRALQGLGPAAFLPAGVMLLGSIYRPGPRKNLAFSLYGACAPLGFFAGVFFSGLSGQYLPWGWYFWIGSILLFLTSCVAFLTIPSDRYERQGYEVRMDWLGVFTIVPGLMLVVFAITDSSHAPEGWNTSYIYVTFVLGCLFLGGAIYVEGWVAEMPLLPFDLFNVKHMKALVIALFLSNGVSGIYLFYASF